MWRDTGELIHDFMEQYTVNSLNDDRFIVDMWTGLYDCTTYSELTFDEQLNFLRAFYNKQDIYRFKDEPHLLQMIPVSFIEQFKGKEIYTNDIVHSEYYFSGDRKVPPSNGVVTFDEDGFYISGEWTPDLCKTEIYNCNIKVIGDVYNLTQLY
jgi:hypothetical protein